MKKVKITTTEEEMFSVITNLISLGSGSSYHFTLKGINITLKLPKSYDKKRVMKSVYEWLNFPRRKVDFFKDEKIKPIIEYDKDEIARDEALYKKLGLL